MRPWLIGLLCGGVAVALAHQGRFDGLENRVLDLRFRICSPRPAPQQVVIVAIDNESIMRLGRWPWPRRVHAELIRRLNEAGARVVALDMLFATPSPDDPVLAGSVAQDNNVVLSSFVAQGTT